MTEATARRVLLAMMGREGFADAAESKIEFTPEEFAQARHDRSIIVKRYDNLGSIMDFLSCEIVAKLEFLRELDDTTSPSPQRQDSLSAQLRDAAMLADRNGMRDAADWIRSGIKADKP